MVKTLIIEWLIVSIATVIYILKNFHKRINEFNYELKTSPIWKQVAMVILLLPLLIVYKLIIAIIGE